MKYLAKKTISLIIVFSFIALAVYYIIQNLGDFAQINLISPVLFIYLTFFFLLTYVAISLVTRDLLRPFKIEIGFSEVYMLSVVTGFYNLITPFRGGLATRAVYLKKKHNFSYTDFMASLTASYILIFLVASIIGLITTLVIYLQSGLFSAYIFLIFLGMFVPLVVVIIFSPIFPETKYSWLNRFIKVINGWNLIKNNKRIILITTIASASQLLMTAVMLYYQFRVFGFGISFIACLFLTSITSLSLLIGITPAGLGIQEAITVFSAATIGISPAQSLSASLIGRLVSVVVLFILGPIFSYILLKRKPTNERKN